MILIMFRIRWYDAFFLFMLAISAIVVSINWDKYRTCTYPLHIWIVADYAAIFAFRILMFLDDGLASTIHGHTNDSDIGFNGRLVALACLALVLYPFLWAWTVIGSLWFTTARNCVSEGQKWGFLVWLLLSYCGLICIACLSMGKWLIRRQMHLQQASEGSTVSEWQVLVDLIRLPNQNLEGVETGEDVRGLGLENATYHPGLFLTQSQREAVEGLIQQLPKFRLKTVPIDCSECPICLEEFCTGNEIRGLPCAHNFHVGCIDEWLRLNIKCPRCRCSVFPNLDLSALGSGNPRRSHGVTSIYFGGDSAGQASAPRPSNAPSVRYVRAPAGENTLLRLQEILHTIRIENALYNEINTGQVADRCGQDGQGRSNSGAPDIPALSGSESAYSHMLAENVVVEQSPPARF